MSSSSLASSRLVLFQMLLAVLLSGRSSEALQVSMVGSSFSRQGTKSVQLPRSFSTPKPIAPPPSPFDLSSGLISQLAIAAIKARLKAQTSVTCDVTASSSGLMFGTVGPVTVAGRGWQSGLGLTCRAIEATVDACELDTGRVLTNRKLALKRPATGRAMIALDARDFGNFLSHPLVHPPQISAPGSSSDNNLHFLRDEVSIDVETGTVHFFAMLNGAKWACALRRGHEDESRAVVQVTATEDGMKDDNMESVTKEFSEKISEYLNTIVFELDGTFLMFRDMMVTNKGSAPSVMLSMGIQVNKFPSRNLAF